MTKLSVNINKIATLRNARGGNMPDLLKMAADIQDFGADGITVHPRPDERHIRYQDVLDLKKVVYTEFNIEGYPSKEFVDLVCRVKPAQVTLVPDLPDAITSSAGWNVQKNFNLLFDVSTEFKKLGIRVSYFLENDLHQVDWSKKAGADRIELYTEGYARNFKENALKSITLYKNTAEYARSIGLDLNAGHDLNLDNLAYFIQEIPYIQEVSIGHALISDALYYGIDNTIKLYKHKLNTFYPL
jgi:pyridoxine 5-phosphate synthase